MRRASSSFLFDAKRPCRGIMQMAPVALLLVLLHISIADDNFTSYEGYKVYRLNYTGKDQFNLVHSTLINDVEVDFWTKEDIMVSPKRQETFEKMLNEMGVKWTVIIDNVQTLIDEERESMNGETRSVSWEKYHSYRKMQKYLQELATQHPNTASVGSIGSSYEGRDLSILRISSGGNDTRPIIFIDAGIHAREWIAPAMALYIIQQLVENPSNADLIANVDWHIVPVLNPDGYEYSRQTSRLWRKTRSKNKCYGVDANRNFNVDWNGEGGSTDPCADIYVGPRAFSEPETAALRDYFKRHETPSASRIKLYLTLHSPGSYILYPWGYTTVPGPNDDKLRALAEKANAALVAAGAKPFTIGQTSRVLYASAGGSDDWAMAKAKVPLAYTIELPYGGSTGFDAPASTIARTVRDFWPAVRAMGEHVRSQLQA